MGTQTWPTSLIPQTFSASLKKAGLQWRSPFNGTTQAVDFVAERWVFSLTLPPKRRSDSGKVEALLMQLAGGIERVRCWHFARPQPLGTLRGTPTMTSQAVRGDTSLAVTTTVGATLKAGDLIGAGGQVFMVASDCTADGAAHITVPVINRVRATISAAAAVTWDAPTVDMILPAMQPAVAYRPAILDGVAFDLEEIW
jgi:hypothetical protein